MSNMTYQRTVKVAAKDHRCTGCGDPILKSEYYIRDQETARTSISGKVFNSRSISFHLQCAPRSKQAMVDGVIEARNSFRIGAPEVMTNTLPCKICGKDNRNQTHSDLERVGHLDHPFDPAIPDPLASINPPKEPDVAEHNRPESMEFSSSEEMIASLRHIALNGCRCESDDDLLSSCACDAARTAQLTLEGLGIGLIPGTVP